MLNLILSCFYFMLPAYFANMAPVIVRKINFLNFPIDLNKKINNKAIFGKNKTWRGLFFGILFAVVISYIQYILYKNEFFIGLSFIDYSNWLLIGLLLGFGAIMGDLIESFVKRRLNYGPGKPFVPWDQLDFIFGALVFIYPIISLSFDKVFIILTLSFVLHIIVNHTAFYLRIRKEKW